LLALSAGASGCRRGTASAPLPTAADPLALLAAPTLSGEPLDIAPLRGKVVVVNFWSPG
jgi:hypothetical protein